MIAESKEEGIETRTFKEGDTSFDFTVVRYHHNGGTKIHIISKSKYSTDTTTGYIKEINDKRIIETCSAAKLFYENKSVIFLSIDTYARIFARINRVETQTLNDDKKELPAFVYWKQINIKDDTEIEHQDITMFDANKNEETKSYEFIRESGKHEYAIIENGKICCINEEEDFKGLVVKPINMKQKFLTKALLSNAYDTYVVDARAGSGKTLIALSAAMKLMDAYKGKGSIVFQKIVYVRNSIESVDKGADIGYLAGNDEKFRIYNMALYDSLEYIARKGIKKEMDQEEEKVHVKEKVEKLIEKYNIELLWPGEARGRTLDDAIVILDEWQNSSANTSQLIISRLTSNCKLIIIGSNKQIDNPYLSKYNNGLTFMLNQGKKGHELLSIYSIDMEKSVRGKFAQFADEVF